MAYARFNEREANPNPHVSFITARSGHDPADEENARQLLRALAAQVRPVMKGHGLVVNNLQEYQYNDVFLGRNWNSGERVGESLSSAIVKIVLRGRSGRFQPISWLLGTLCHELAHIKHMNHGPGFEALNAQLCKEVRQLQNKGYYGDGLWSSGQRLADSAQVGGPGLTDYKLPEYLCGGAQSRAPPPSTQRRRRRRNEGPSNHTGRQTAKKRKAGARVTAKDAFEGAGRSLIDDIEDGNPKKEGTGFRKQAGSKKAREERALAVERRLLALQNLKAESPAAEDSVSGSESEYDEPENLETDQDRRRTLLESDANAGKLKQTTLYDFANDFLLPSSHAATSSDNDSSTANGKSKASKRAGASMPVPSSSKRQRKVTAGRAVGNKSLTDFFTSEPETRNADEDSNDDRQQSKKQKKVQKSSSGSLSYGGLVQDEMTFRKKEALGMQAGSIRMLGDRRAAGSANSQLAGRSRLLDLIPEKTTKGSSGGDHEAAKDAAWSCAVCTLTNEPIHLACSACGTPRSESSWRGDS
ncbi:WLM domain-containing protein [Irpex rosettiformis]|uniref:WLM domain-containing protein n=1 Tax=Irpex rosettiformis TaxID=378272 RepID=A0ACB8UA47_9APHY|nr:WLM domain-containing protein [Irpex rosettiformis]